MESVSTSTQMAAHTSHQVPSNNLQSNMISQTSASIINHLKSIMARHGICEYFHSDGGKYFTSSTFKEFAKQYDVEIVTSSPKLAQSNGMIERHVGTIKDMLKKAEDPYIALLAYRTTPLHNGFSHAELLMGRKLHTTLPMQPKLLNPKWPGLGKVSNGAKIRNRYNQVPHLTQDTNGKVTNSQKTPQTRAKRSALSQQVTTKHI